MKNSKVLIFVAVLVAAIAAAVLFASSGDKKGGNQSDTSTVDTSTAVATDTVAIEDFNFNPKTITIKAGTKVTWTNKDNVSHTVTADEKSGDAPDSGSIGQNQSFSFTFNKVGTYKYHCTPHPTMQGTVVVTE